MSRRSFGLLALAPALLAGCLENPMLPADHEEEIEIELSFSPDHIHTLGEVTFTVRATNDHGEEVADFDSLVVEQRQVGSDTWLPIELTLGHGGYEGTYTFASSGPYEFRVAGRRGDHAEMSVLHALHDPVSIGRAHIEEDGVRIEYENFPGHVHEGQSAVAKFWVFEVEKDASGERPPIAGLQAEVICGDPSGETETHHAMEQEPGVYQAEHTFAAGGEATMRLRFTNDDGHAVQAHFNFNVSHGH